MISHKQFALVIILVGINMCLYAETITARLISITPNLIYVGIETTARYSLDSIDNDIDFSKISFISNDDFIIKNVRIALSNSQLENKLQNKEMILQFIVKKTGVISIPHVRLEDNTVLFPHINVMSSIDTSENTPILINLYVPWREVIELFILIILLLVCLWTTVLLVMYMVKQSRSTRHVLANFFSLWNCMRQIDKLIFDLKHVESKRKRKFLVTTDCYSRILAILQKRLMFFLPKNIIFSLTTEEIGKVMMGDSTQEFIHKHAVLLLFQAIDQVLYGKKKYAIDIRLMHCKVFKNLLTYSFKMKKNHYVQYLDKYCSLSKNTNIQRTI